MTDYVGESFDPTEILGEMSIDVPSTAELGAGVLTVHVLSAVGPASPPERTRWDGKSWQPESDLPAARATLRPATVMASRPRQVAPVAPELPRRGAEATAPKPDS